MAWLTAKAVTAAELDVTTNQAALIKETLHLCAQLGPRLWKDWTNSTTPILLRTKSAEFLLFHPSPPSDFRLTASTVFGERLWTRPTPDQADLTAAYPIGGVKTAVVSALSPVADPCVWVLKAAHEVFHCHQGLTRVVDPFVGKYATNNELNFPFPYGRSAVQSAFRLEAEVIHGVCSAPVGASSPEVMPLRLLRHTWNVEKAVLGDEQQFQFKEWMEWSEGVARYTERQLADLARDSGLYVPLAEFRTAFPEGSYQNVWEHHYQGEINPVRFVGEGVRGSVMFYYLGMGKAYALDRLMPNWKDLYRGHSLNALLMQREPRPNEATR